MAPETAALTISRPPQQGSNSYAGGVSTTSRPYTVPEHVACTKLVIVPGDPAETPTINPLLSAVGRAYSAPPCSVFNGTEPPAFWAAATVLWKLDKSMSPAKQPSHN